MSQAIPTTADCCHPCDDVLTTTVPGATGATGAAGTNGTNGVNAFTLLDGGFTMPAEGANVVTVVDDNTWMALGQILFIQSAGYMEVAALNVNGVGVTLTNLEDTAAGTYPDNAAPGAAIPNDSKVSPGGVTGPDGSIPAGALLAANDLSDVASAATSRSNLGLGTAATRTVGVANTNLSPVDDAAGLTNGEMLRATAAGIESIPAATARTAIGVGTISTQSAAAVAITGGTIDGTVIGGGTPAAASVTTLSSSGNRTESGRVIQTPSTIQTLLAAGTVNANAAKVRVVGDGAARTLTSTPSITAGVADGQRLLIKGTDAVNTITLQDDGTLPGSTLELGAATRVLGLNSQIELSWDSTTSMWCEISFSAN